MLVNAVAAKMQPKTIKGMVKLGRVRMLVVILVVGF